MKTVTNKLFSVFAALAGTMLLIPAVASAAVLVNYPFTGGSWASTVQEPGTTITNMQPGNGGVQLSSGGGNLYYQFPSQHNKDQAIENNYYAEFTITPDNGLGISYSEIRFHYHVTTPWNSETILSFHANFFVRASLDGYSSDLASFFHYGTGSSADNPPVLFSLELSNLNDFQEVTQPVTFRIYSYTDNFVNTNFITSALPRVDNVIVEGSLSPIPEPAYTAVLTILFLIMITVCKRCRSAI